MNQPKDYPQKTIVGVYGTLKKGGSNHGLLSDSQFIGLASTLPAYSLVSMGGYPGLLPGEDTVLLELYEVDDKTLYYLDALEGHPNYYRRELIEVITEKGEKGEAWVYHLASPEKYAKREPVYTYKDSLGHLNWDRVHNASLWAR